MADQASARLNRYLDCSMSRDPPPSFRSVRLDHNAPRPPPLLKPARWPVRRRGRRSPACTRSKSAATRPVHLCEVSGRPEAAARISAGGQRYRRAGAQGPPNTGSEAHNPLPGRVGQRNIDKYHPKAGQAKEALGSISGPKAPILSQIVRNRAEIHSLEQAALESLGHRVRPAGCAEFGQDILDLSLDCTLAQIQRLRHILGAGALSQQA